MTCGEARTNPKQNEWHSRGQRFDPARLHHSRVSSRIVSTTPRSASVPLQLRAERGPVPSSLDAQQLGGRAA
jgi:hypothetical protein